MFKYYKTPNFVEMMIEFWNFLVCDYNRKDDYINLVNN